jgi:hypothetical protein
MELPGQQQQLVDMNPPQHSRCFTFRLCGVWPGEPSTQPTVGSDNFAGCDGRWWLTSGPMAGTRGQALVLSLAADGAGSALQLAPP